MILDQKEKPLGIQILGPQAGELLSEWVSVFNGKVKLSTLASAVHPYPTLGEINKRVAGKVFTPKIFSDKVKKGLKSIPVVGAGGINEPNLAERILKNKEVDMLALGRAFFADPRWVDKVRSKRISSIRPCIRCNICHLKLFQNQLLKWPIVS